MLAWGRRVIKLYDECASRHDAAVQAWPQP
jgi:hypothetical protein